MSEGSIEPDGEVVESAPAPVAQTSNGDARKVQRVTPSMVASARAQIVIAEQLGKSVSPAIRKIAAVPLAS